MNTRAKPKISTAIDNLEVDRLREEDAAKEEEEGRGAAKAVQGKAKETGRGRGASGKMGHGDW